MSEPTRVCLPGTEAHRIVSRHVDQEFEIRVGLPVPARGAPPSSPLPVLYVTDGDLFFGTALECTRLMHQLFQELPALLVVGVGYGDDDPAVQGELRNRDFTPTADAEFEAMGRRMMPGWQPLLPDGQRMGGAAAFRRFLVEELRPFLEQRYPVGGPNVLFGVSLGGLFALHTLLSAPASFDAYVAGSPAIWWDDAVLFRVEEEQAASGVAVDADVFLSAGGLEEGTGNPFVDRFRVLTNLEAMRARLEARGDRGPRVTAHVFPDETHTSVVPSILTRGVREVLGRGAGR